MSGRKRQPAERDVPRMTPEQEAIARRAAEATVEAAVKDITVVMIHEGASGVVQAFNERGGRAASIAAAALGFQWEMGCRVFGSGGALRDAIAEHAAEVMSQFDDIESTMDDAATAMESLYGALYSMSVAATEALKFLETDDPEANPYFGAAVAAVLAAHGLDPDWQVI